MLFSGAQPRGSALEARAYFFLVAKSSQKNHPGSAPGVAQCLRYSARAGLRNSALLGPDSPRPLSRPIRTLRRRLSKGPKGVSALP